VINIAISKSNISVPTMTSFVPCMLSRWPHIVQRCRCFRFFTRITISIVIHFLQYIYRHFNILSERFNKRRKRRYLVFSSSLFNEIRWRYRVYFMSKVCYGGFYGYCFPPLPLKLITVLLSISYNIYINILTFCLKDLTKEENVDI
jgi:hypothetical protein